MNEELNAKNGSNQFLSIAEVQNYLGIKSRKTILKYITEQKLPAYKLGGTRWRVALEDVEAFLKNQMVSASSPKKADRVLV